MSEKTSISAYYKNKAIVITGGLGYIGSAVIRALYNISCNIIVVTKENRRDADFSDGAAQVSVIEADIRSKNIWKDLLGDADILFHFAAQTSLSVANSNPSFDTEVNLLPVINIIETCQKNNFSPHIVFSGTVTEAGLTITNPVNESFRDTPITVYDINKLAAEKYLQFYSNQLGNFAVTLRLPNVYGPGPKSSSADRGILNAMIRKALSDEPLTVYGDGNFIRDYIYIDDVAEAFLLAGAEMDTLKGNYYVIGTGVGYTIKDAVGIIKDEVMQKTGKNVEIIFVPPPENISQIEYRNFVADSKSFNSLTGWRTKISLHEGIKMTINYFLKEL